MKCATPATVACLILLATVTCGQVRADGLFSKGFAGIANAPESSASTPTPSRPSGPRRLRPDEVKDVLTQLGYDVEPIDERLFKITLKRDSWTMPVLVNVTKSGKKLWFSIRLVTLEGGPNQHAERIRKLLSLGGAFGAEFFSCTDDGLKIMLMVCRENENLTNAEIKSILEHMSLVVVKTAPLGDPTARKTPMRNSV